MSKKINVAVLMGGKSSEHDISLMSGTEIVNNLNPKKYNVLPITISRNGTNWQIGTKSKKLFNYPAGKKIIKSRKKNQGLQRTENTSFFKENNIDVVFIALHGKNGEDGSIQGFLQLAQVPYTGSKILASSLAMDKIMSRKILQTTGLTVPNFLVYKKTDKPKKIWGKFKLPIIIKPPDQGSSVGVSKVLNKSQLTQALKKAFKYSDFSVVEEFVKGTEITCSILGNDKLVALPIVEIVPKNDFFDFEAKYDESKCDEICPARISSRLTKEAKEAAVKAYKALGCEGFGRVDMIIKNNKIFVLEVNTIPGLTSVSLFPKAAKEANINYPELLEKIIYYAVPRS